MRKKELTQIYQIFNKTFRDITLTFAGLALENNFEDEVITDFHNCFDKFLNSQVKIKFYHIKRPSIFHRKFILIDNKTLLIGSFNLSFNGLENNKEIMVEIKDKKAINTLLNIINEDFY